MQEGDIFSVPILDENIVMELRDLMEEEFNDLMDTYLRDLPNHLARIQDARSAGDSESIWRIAHTLKAASGSIGALRIAELCRQLEMAGRDQAHQLMAPLLEQLPTVAEETETALRSQLDT